jgi:hypothetical protein
MKNKFFFWTLFVFISACGSGPVKHSPLEPATTVQGLGIQYGKPACFFSYVMDEAKYDLVTYQDSPSVVVFENGVLYTVIPSESKPLSEFDRILIKSMEKEDLPLENGLEGIHAWVKGNKEKNAQPIKLDGHSMNALDSAGATAVMAAGLPIWFPFAVVGGMEHILTRQDREKAMGVNQSLLESSMAYEAFLSKLSNPDMEVAKKSYGVKMFILDKSFFSSGSFIYMAGYENSAIRWVSFNHFHMKTKIFEYHTKTTTQLLETE